MSACRRDPLGSSALSAPTFEIVIGVHPVFAIDDWVDRVVLDVQPELSVEIARLAHSHATHPPDNDARVILGLVVAVDDVSVNHEVANVD